jgi:hypothetical protein
VKFILSLDSADTWLESPRKEISKSRILVKSITGSLLDLDSIDGREEAKEGSSNIEGHIAGADPASEAALNSSDGYHKSELLELLEELVEEQEVSNSSNYLDVWQFAVDDLGLHRNSRGACGVEDTSDTVIIRLAQKLVENNKSKSVQGHSGGVVSLPERHLNDFLVLIKGK